MKVSSVHKSKSDDGYARGLKTVFALLIAAVVSITGTQLAAADTTQDTAATDQAADRELVLGLVYGLGDAADSLGIKVQSDAGTSSTKQKQYEAAAHRSVDLMFAQHGQALEPAMESLRSGDPVRTEAGLQQLGVVVNEFSQEQLQKQGKSVSSVSAQSEASTQACGVAVVCVAYAAAAVHNTVAVTGLVAVVVGGVLWCGAWKWCSASSGDASSQAAKERLVLDIAAIS